MYHLLLRTERLSVVEITTFTIATIKKVTIQSLVFSIAITSLGEERANLSAFRTFVRFVLV